MATAGSTDKRERKIAMPREHECLAGFATDGALLGLVHRSLEALDRLLGLGSGRLKRPIMAPANARLGIAEGLA